MGAQELQRKRSENLCDHWCVHGGSSATRLWFSRASLSGSLAIEFAKREIPFMREIKLPLQYKGQVLDTKYCADFICFNSVVVELKALARMSGTEEAQVINYLKATGHEVGLLINFGARSLEHRRFVLTKSVQSA